MGHSQLPDSEGGESSAITHIAEAMRWHHFECFSKMKGAKWMSANVPSDVNNIGGVDALAPEDKSKVQILISALHGNVVAVAGDKRQAKEQGGGGKRGKGEPLTAAEQLSKLSSVQGVLNKDQFEKMQKQELELSKSTGAQLSAELEKNNQPKTGKKDELVQRVAEGRVLGRLPVCPKCEKGRLRWSRIGGMHTCPGFVDEEGNPRRCSFKAAEVERLPWKT